jgi:hypothetical protein
MWRLCRRRQMGAVLFLWVFIISVFSFYPQVYYIIKILQVYIMYNASFLDGSGGGVVFFRIYNNIKRVDGPRGRQTIKQ